MYTKNSFKQSQKIFKSLLQALQTKHKEQGLNTLFMKVPHRRSFKSFYH